LLKKDTQTHSREKKEIPLNSHILSVENSEENNIAFATVLIFYGC